MTQSNIPILLLFPLERRCDPSFHIFESPKITQGYSVPSLVEIGQVILEKKIFKSRQCIFSNVAIISPWKQCMALNLNITQEYFVSCLVEIGPAVLEKIFKSCQYFFNFCYYLPLEKGQGPSFERNWMPLTHGCSVPSLVEIGQVVVLENKSSMYFHYVANISLWQRAWPFFGKNLNRLHLGMLYVKYGGTWLGILKKLICEKIWMDTWTDRQIDNR